MYMILADDRVLWDPILSSEGYSIISPCLRVGVNKAGSLSFTMPPSHPLYSSIQKMKTIIRVELDGEEIWSGRVEEDEKDFYNRKEIYCAGRLSFLLDSVIRPYSYDGGVYDYFKKFLDVHNSEVDSFKQFKIGNVTVQDPNDYIVRANNNYQTVYKEMEEKLLDLLGGYFVVRKGNDGYYLDYLAESGPISDQTIEFGKNLLDLSMFVSASDVFTVLIPLGGKNDNGERLTVSSVNDGKDYIVNETAAALFGKIWQTAEWDDVTVPANLLTKGINHLNENVKVSSTIKVNAVDLAMLGMNVKSLWVGDRNRVVSVPHGVDAFFTLSEAALYLSDPGKSEYTFGYTLKSLTDRQAAVEKSSSTVVAVASDAASTAQAAAEEVINIIADIPTDFVSGETFTQFKNAVENKLAAVFHVKGSVASYGNLPIIDNTVGDVYNVLDTGANYVYTSAGWDKLSETIDLSGLVEQADFAALEARVAALEGGSEPDPGNNGGE